MRVVCGCWRETRVCWRADTHGVSVHLVFVHGFTFPPPQEDPLAAAEAARLALGATPLQAVGREELRAAEPWMLLALPDVACCVQEKKNVVAR